MWLFKDGRRLFRALPYPPCHQYAESYCCLLELTAERPSAATTTNFYFVSCASLTAEAGVAACARQSSIAVTAILQQGSREQAKHMRDEAETNAVVYLVKRVFCTAGFVCSCWSIRVVGWMYLPLSGRPFPHLYTNIYVENHLQNRGSSLGLGRRIIETTATPKAVEMEQPQPFVAHAPAPVTQVHDPTHACYFPFINQAPMPHGGTPFDYCHASERPDLITLWCPCPHVVGLSFAHQAAITKSLKADVTSGSQATKYGAKGHPALRVAILDHQQEQPNGRH